MKLAIISGGSKGLERALCETCRQSGYEVVEFSRSAPHAYSVACDFADPQNVSAVIAERLNALAQQEISELLVINNAGVLTPIRPVQAQASHEVIAHLHINVVSAILFMSAALQVFQKHECQKVLINISSGAALKGRAGWSLYCASKAAGENFIRAVALEQALQLHPFKVLNVDPGVMDTAMQTQIRACTQENFPDVAVFVERKEKGVLRAPVLVAQAVMRIVCAGQESGVRVSTNDFLGA